MKATSWPRNSSLPKPSRSRPSGPTPNRSTLDLGAQQTGLSREVVRRALKADPEQATEVLRNSLYYKAVEHVMARARVEVVDSNDQSQ